MFQQLLFKIIKDSGIGALTLIGVILVNSIGVYFLWTWFVAPTFGYISLPQATGMTLLLSVLGFFQSPSYKSEDQKERNKQDWARLFSEVAKVALYLLLGFALNHFFS